MISATKAFPGHRFMDVACVGGQKRDFGSYHSLAMWPKLCQLADPPSFHKSKEDHFLSRCGKDKTRKASSQVETCSWTWLSFSFSESVSPDLMCYEKLECFQFQECGPVLETEEAELVPNQRHRNQLGRNS